MVREPEFLAPVVRIRRTGRHVFLIAWERDKNGRWRGRVAWLARENVAWRGVDALRAYYVWAGSPSYREMERRCAKQISYSTFRNVLNGDVLPKLHALEIFVKVLGGSSEDVQAWATAWRQITMGDFSKIGRIRKTPKPEGGA